VLENSVLRKISGLKRDEVKVGENYIMWSFTTCTLCQVIRMIRSRRMRWAGHLA
jgi:hypothetical protein